MERIGKPVKRLEILETEKRTYRDVPVFEAAEDAEAAGYHLLYHDAKSGMAVYGRPIDGAYPRVLTIAEVPEERENG